VRINAKPSALPDFGQGVYSLNEVARYASLHPSTVRAWFKGRSDQVGRGPLFRSDYPLVDDSYAVSFLDLIDACVAGRFRKAGVKLSKLRKAYELLKEDLNTHHPFAHDRLYTDGSNVIVGVEGRLNRNLLYDAVSRQQLFEELRRVLEKVDYQVETHLARQFRIADGVVINPDISLGKPVICGTGTETWVISRQFFANRQNAPLVAELFDISERDVANAVDFERNYSTSAAA
jgi:uncharacterized protein (DUF433 family)